MQSKNNLLLPNKRKILWFLGLIPFVVMHNISAVFIEVRGVVLEHLGFSALGYFLGLASSAFMLPIFERNIAKKKANGKIWCLIFLLILLLPGFFSLLVPFFVDNPYTDNRFINTLQPFLWALLLPVAFKLFFHQALAGLHGILFGMVVAIGHLFWALLIPIISRSENNIQMLSASVGNVYLPFLNTTRCIFGIAFALIAWQLIVSSTTHSPEQKDVQETFSDHQESPKLSESVFWSLLLSVAGCFFLSGIIKYIYAEQLILRQLNLGYLHLILALLFLFIGFWVTNSGSRSLKTLMTAALLCLAITPFLLYLFPFSPLSYVLPFLYATSHQIAIFSGFLFFGYFTIQFNCKALTVASILFAMSSSIFGNLFAIHFFPIPFMPHIFFACIFFAVCMALILFVHRIFPLLRLAPQAKSTLGSNDQMSQDEMMQHFSALHKLRNREVQIMKMLLNGLSSGEMVEILGLKESTIRTYTQALLKKTGTNSRLGLVAAFLAFKDSE